MDIFSCIDQATVKQIMTPRDEFTWYSQSIEVEEMEEFDYFPWLNEETCEVRGIFEKSSNQVIQNVNSWTISQNTRIIDLIDKFDSKRPFLLVRSSQVIVGLVTIADLNKDQFRIILFSMLIKLEIALTELVRRFFSGDQAQLALLFSPEKWEKINEVYENHQKEKLETDKFACLQLSDLINILSRTEGLRNFFSLPSRTNADQYFRGFVSLRHQIAHLEEISSINVKIWPNFDRN